jgi:hypothetical protein
MNLIAPTGFRKGNTFLWKNAKLSFNKKSNEINTADSIMGRSLLSALGPIIRRHRLNILGGSVVRDHYADAIKVNVLYCPRFNYRIKSRNPQWFFIKGLTHRRGAFTRRTRTLEMLRGGLIDDKMYRYKYRNLKRRRVRTKYRHGRIRGGGVNRLITRSFMRGSAFLVKRKKSLTSHKKILNRVSDKKRLQFRRFLMNYSRFTPWHPRVWVDVPKGKWVKFAPKFYPMKWRMSRTPLRKVNKHKLSEILSSSIGRPIQIVPENILNYVAKKGKSSYYEHQQYVWTPSTKRFRRRYPQYMDIMNAFFLFAVFRGYNNILAQYLLRMITRPLRRIYKIRRFFKFIDAIILDYTLIKRQFRTFKIILAGKLTGGTKRTKLFSIGYGQVVWQTLANNVTMNFMSYDHKFGEFGVKLFVTRRSEIVESRKTHTLKPATVNSWSKYNYVSPSIYNPITKETTRGAAPHKATFKKNDRRRGRV